MDKYKELKRCKPGSTRIDEQEQVWRICLPSNSVWCGKEKLIKDFKLSYNDSPFDVRYICKECHSIDKKQRAENNFLQTWARGTINKHKKNDCIINFTNKELRRHILHIDCCQYCIVELNWGADGNKNGKTQSNSPTMDNIFRKKELYLHDVAIVCYQCNCAKGIMTIKEWIDYIKRLSGSTDQILEVERKAKEMELTSVSENDTMYS